jgi:hypothetical protein
MKFPYIIATILSTTIMVSMAALIGKAFAYLFSKLMS